jgi:hypothetical protein
MMRPDAPPVEFDTTREAADAKAMRAFVRGIIVGAVLAGALAYALPAWAGEVSISGTTVTMEPSDEPGVVAVITMNNISMNGSRDVGAYQVAMPGLVVEFTFEWQVNELTGSDSITVTPPDGMRCEPVSCVAEVMEGQSGSVRLLEWIGS